MSAHYLLALGVMAVMFLIPIFLITILMQAFSRKRWVKTMAAAFIAAMAIGWFFGWVLTSGEGVPLAWMDRITAALPMMVIAIVESVLIVRLVSRHID